MYNVNIKTVSETKSSIKSKSISHKINKAYRPNAHLLDTLMHYNINII